MCGQSYCGAYYLNNTDVAFTNCFVSFQLFDANRGGF